MTALVPIRRALLSVSDKTDLLPFARSLREFGVEIVSTGGTARALAAGGLNVITVDTVTGFPEMMDGRVKTLHPMIHGGLLARRDAPAHVEAMRAHGIKPIDLVCVNLYPFERTILAPDVKAEAAIEQIDIGGPAILRSAAKNHEFVTVVTNPDQYDRVVSELRNHDGATTHELRRDLAAAAFMRTAEYDTAISAWMSSRRDEPFPALLQLTYAYHGALRYGENPHQRAALYSNPASGEPSVVSAELLRGKPLGYNNVNDAAEALALIQDLDHTFPGRAAAVIVKHTNPCGAALGASAAESFERAWASDPVAAYGGILALNRPIIGSAASAIIGGQRDGERFLEVIVAPGFEPEAAERLGERWPNARLLSVAGLEHTGRRKMNYRSIPGGMLVQERDMKLASPASWQHVAGPAPDEAILETAAFAWTIAKHLTSNAIAIAGSAGLLGAAAGQVDRVGACRVAVARAGRRLAEEPRPVAASDAFFPFADGPEALIEAGVRCLVSPGGSKRDQETIDLCAARDVTCLLTGDRHFRH